MSLQRAARSERFELASRAEHAEAGPDDVRGRSFGLDAGSGGGVMPDRVQSVKRAKGSGGGVMPDRVQSVKRAKGSGGGEGSGSRSR